MKTKLSKKEMTEILDSLLLISVGFLGYVTGGIAMVFQLKYMGAF